MTNDPSNHLLTIEFRRDIEMLRKLKQSTNIFNWFTAYTKTNDATYTLSLPPIPPRPRVLGTFAGPVNEQRQSLLLQLPAELKNQIYEYVFTTENSPDTTNAAETLPLLLVCRKLNLEASILAFKHHMFVINIDPEHIPNIKIFQLFRRLDDFLPAPLQNAVTRLAYTLNEPIVHPLIHFTSNAILLFPSLKTLLIRARVDIFRTTREGFASSSNHPLRPALAVDWRCRDPRREVEQRYIPAWFMRVFTSLVAESDAGWPRGQKWEVEYGLYESGAFDISPSSLDVSCQLQGKSKYANEDAIDTIEGFVWCVCCRETLIWVTANLVQETGRTVHVEVVYDEVDMEGIKREIRAKEFPGDAIELLPNSDGLPTQVIANGSGIMRDGEEPSHMGAKAKTGGLGAMIQSYWNGWK